MTRRHPRPRLRRLFVRRLHPLALAAAGGTMALLFGGVFASPTPARAPAAPLSALTVGGGPNVQYNQVAIESNVRYVDSLLPPSAPRRILFADGKTDSKTVLYQEPPPELPPAESAFRSLFEQERLDSPTKLRAPRLPRIDGPCKREAITEEFGRLSATTGDGGAFLYFTGHGGPNSKGDLENNTFGLWNDGDFTVRELAAQIARLPAGRPVVLVMVQCYGGSFGNVIFADGNPAADAALIDRPLAGFFATTRDRVAAGCTPEVNEAEYHDFTSSFFAALTGKDRVGRAVHATDFDNDGQIEMDEAFADAMLHDPSIDVPVCTSDVFLRHYLSVPDDEAASTPYPTVREWASPLQKAVLDGLSTALHLTGDDRLKTALTEVRNDMVSRGNRGRRPGGPGSNPGLRQQRSALRQEATQLTERFSGLSAKHDSSAYKDARTAALSYLKAHPEEVKRIQDASDAMDGAFENRYQDELRGAQFLRLMRMAKTVYLEHRLRQGTDKNLIERFDRLRAREHMNPLKS